MRLTLSETAQRLGKTERQVRYMIEQGQVAAKKRGGRWFLESEDLPLSDGQKEAMDRQVRQLRDAVDDTLGIASTKRRYSVRDLVAFQIALPLFQQSVKALGADHPASQALHRMLDLLSRGCHRFEPAEKGAAYREARDAASSAVCELLLSGEDTAGEIATEIEQDLMAAFAGLLRRAEGRRRR